MFPVENNTDTSWVTSQEPDFVKEHKFVRFIVVPVFSGFFWVCGSVNSVLIKQKGFDSRHRCKRCIRLRSVSNSFHLTGTKATYFNSRVTCLSDFSVIPVTTQPWIFWHNWIAKNPHRRSVLVFTDYGQLNNIRHLYCFLMLTVKLVNVAFMNFIQQILFIECAEAVSWWLSSQFLAEEK